MWHEARRQERKIRGIMVDFKRRADRRKEFYEKIKQDPTQFLRMYGRPVKIHLDPAVATAAEGPQSMMPWQGDSTNMIDRFDVRANLDLIPPYVPDKHAHGDVIDEEERFGNYERYRTLVENEAAGLSEEQCLHQIYLDEHFGTITRSNEEEKKKNADKKAAIGFVYEDSTPAKKEEKDDEDEEEESDDDIETADLDVTIDIDDLTPDQVRELNGCASHYGMKGDDFSRLLKKDKEELEMLREARQLEEAKAQFSGRKSRRERRAINEKRQNPQRFSRPSYAARESPKYEPYKRPGSVSPSRSRSRSRSMSSEAAPVTFITSFGAESDDEGVVQGPALPANIKLAVPKEKPSTKSSKCEAPWRSNAKPGSRSTKLRSRSHRSSSRSWSRSRSSKSRSRSRSRPLRHRTSKSSSRSISNSKSRSRSRSGSRRNSRRRGSRPSGRRSRSSSYSRSPSRSKSRSRSGSRSPQTQSTKRSASPAKKLPIKRYRRDSLSSKSELSGLDSDEETKKDNSSSTRSSPQHRAGTSITKSDLTKSGKIDSKPQQSQIAITTGGRESMKERLKRRMQAQLSKQFKADKKAEITRISKQEQERMDREEEIRNMALEIRRREREKRHKEREEEEKQQDSSSSDSDKSSRASPRKKSKSPADRRERSSRRDERSGGDRRDSHSSSSNRSRRDDRSERDERRKSPHQFRPLAEIRADRSEERRGDRHRDREHRSSRWGDGGDSRGPSRSDRDGSGRSSRWEQGSGQSSQHRRGESGNGRGLRDEDLGRQRYGSWEDPRRDWRDGNWNRRGTSQVSAGYNSNGRPRVPLLPRPRSPLMSRPRPPNDPRLMEG
ncbi:clk4-associating serine/arginine rich protein [Plakobranchus ocellatus]|uniref:Clk4-associating serine/arginine rich protein n=1 Tax=Plakobranchus ocellatus TaxID=259542 RepID=A0AAV3ZT20_9GAST|nr:clk4-associating serine/arginine rich protein [Plakobranchus ocellatus]